MAWDNVERRSKDSDLPARVLVLEDQTKALRKELHEGFVGLNKRLDDQANKSATNWPTIFAGLALVLTLVGAIGAAYIAPITVGMGYQEKISTLQNTLIQEKFEAVKTATALSLNQGIELEKETSKANEKFKEIETQIGWMRDVSNMQKVDSWFRMAVIWKKVFDTEMPMPVAPTVGPGKNGNN